LKTRLPDKAKGRGCSTFRGDVNLLFPFRGSLNRRKETTNFEKGRGKGGCKLRGVKIQMGRPGNLVNKKGGALPPPR